MIIKHEITGTGINSAAKKLKAKAPNIKAKTAQLKAKAKSRIKAWAEQL